MGAPTGDTTPIAAIEHLEELARLADTAGAEVVGTLRQRLDAPHPKYFIGEGKAVELKELVRAAGADLVIFDDELTPAQGKNLETLVGVRVMDRTELILDIFATRARSSEARMQVELAQLQYMMPRLKRMWTHLSRIRGGIGLRGPGETQLETDRRIIQRRIRDLRAKLEVVAQRRATQRKGRAGQFRVALVGYTNAGKSSVLRVLSGAEVFVEDRLFATLDPATRAVDLGPAGRVLVTDTVGFIRKLPHHLVASFRATLEEATEADLLLHVVDASHPGWEEQVEVVEEVLADMGLRDRPTVLVFNKVDRLTHDEEAALRARVEAIAPVPPVFSSTVEPGGMDELRRRLQEELAAARPQVHLRIPVVDGEALAALYREGEVVHMAEVGAEFDVVARLPRAALGRLSRRAGVQVVGAA
ncbi:MAG TPA: GTPase HflX [Longimicrobiales bacterium]|nr:GTPase HflX [Longimicrobiales bacterium]